MGELILCQLLQGWELQQLQFERERKERERVLGWGIWIPYNKGRMDIKDNTSLHKVYYKYVWSYCIASRDQAAHEAETSIAARLHVFISTDRTLDRCVVMCEDKLTTFRSRFFSVTYKILLTTWQIVCRLFIIKPRFYNCLLHAYRITCTSWSQMCHAMYSFCLLSCKKFVERKLIERNGEGPT